MARPLGAKNKPKGEPGMGDNSEVKELTPEQKRSLLMQACEEIGAMKDEMAHRVSELRAVYKSFKADGIPKKDIDFALQLQRMEPDAVIERVTRHAQIIEWIHPGVQAELDFSAAAE